MPYTNVRHTFPFAFLECVLCGGLRSYTRSKLPSLFVDLQKWSQQWLFDVEQWGNRHTVKAGRLYSSVFPAKRQARFISLKLVFMALSTGDFWYVISGYSLSLIRRVWSHRKLASSWFVLLQQHLAECHRAANKYQTLLFISNGNRRDFWNIRRHW